MHHHLSKESHLQGTLFSSHLQLPKTSDPTLSSVCFVDSNTILSLEQNKYLGFAKKPSVIAPSSGQGKLHIQVHVFIEKKDLISSFL